MADASYMEYGLQTQANSGPARIQRQEAGEWFCRYTSVYVNHVSLSDETVRFIISTTPGNRYCTAVCPPCHFSPHLSTDLFVRP